MVSRVCDVVVTDRTLIASLGKPGPDALMFCDENGSTLRPNKVSVTLKVYAHLFGDGSQDKAAEAIERMMN
jgi:hypothetical protein